ncbi:uncharacterized protein EDB93DRAFT_1273254 [Suillus bovinus]|uniref:uncharacterized protein n=1 Tax=Suillus bovinus TaxID=48563 RepID=UPI001B86DF5E|nr:uncharacterized protein EDB93DRAFT_1273254 [Suillus bovinus]KAG2152580.1 hypothetical protein EDB93DRAFT_1273254 [Suillus bovinus]
MTIVLNDPAWWANINANRIQSYFVVAAIVGVTYDWTLTLGQEVELVWRQRWSLMTLLYLSVRYLGILYAALNMFVDSSGFITFVVRNWTNVLVFAMLWVIIITRLHAMYERSRKILIFLVFTFLAVNIFDGVVVVLLSIYVSGEELILSGTYQCSFDYAEGILLLPPITWILGTVWEVLAVCLAVWIAAKHFRETRQHSAGGTVEDCFRVLMKTHLVYFASFVAISCLQLITDFSPTLSTDQNPLETQTFYGLLEILEVP